MEIKQIKELMASMGRSGIKRLVLKNKNFAIELEREGREGGGAEFLGESDVGSGREYQTIRKVSYELPSSKNLPPLNTPPKGEEDGIFITSPMVGTFYAAPSPDDPPFVKVGDKVEKHTIVAIIEAMKVMNEIKAGHTGAIVEALVESGSPVEFGTKLFRIVNAG